MHKIVTIITPSYNTEAYISKTIESVLAQSYRDWEMTIIDDCSSDNSVEIIERYVEQDSRIKLIVLEKNSGPAVSRNRAIEEARGEYMAFLDSDDLWDKNKLSKQIAFMQEKDIALSFTGYYRIKEDTGETIDRQYIPLKVDYTTMLKQNIMGCLTVMYDVKKLGKVYMPNILRRQDYALWLKILKTVPYAYGINEPLAYYRLRTTSSVSSNKFIASGYHWKVLRDIEKLPLYKAIYYFGWYTYKSILKYGKR